MILACVDGGLLCVPALLAGAGALVAWIRVKTDRKSEEKQKGP